MEFLQYVVNILSLGGIYALLALGLAIVFSIVGLINFAHGEIMTISGYLIVLSLSLGIPLPLGLIIAVAGGAVTAILMDRVAFRPMRSASVTTLLITSFAVSTIIKVLLQNGVSARAKPVALPEWMSGTVQFSGFQIGVVPLTSIILTVAVLVCLDIFLRKTTLGIAMRAASEDFVMVSLLGLRANTVIATSFAISGVLAAIAAVLWVSQRGSVDPLMGFTPVLKAFIAAILGGLGSLRGAVAGGFILGGLEVGSELFLTSGTAPYRDAIVLMAVVALLVVKPEGLIPASRAQRS
ncbi:branched-chain amino acid ABC transporter permease [Phyllobacterium zundukense]|uniref:Branched-chain amino acid ABC transporter permease n=1 Tax=Phyllobacterium zundukense TaxID=1867719 RepID=A0A2N9W1A0_9HYPH|nr:branched-chain amino acid ABC transporter permease [Phyllobacterium zundukense]ATU95382.1 branched-chain amino acid ABC transporter permease [Phyllobacterium zundukense]PIO45518.1 branched-chain amino acid ABC transporter permease [Phyllobacterium zundukense]